MAGELIVCTRREHVEARISPGFTPFSDDLASRLDAASGSWTILPRTEDLEEDEGWVQWVAYVVARAVVADDVALVGMYRRPFAAGDGRLDGKLSVGMAGHVERRDTILDPGGGAPTRTVDHAMDAVFRAADREIREEVRSDWPAAIDLEARPRWRRVVGVIREDSDAVGRVHLGVVVERYFGGPGCWTATCDRAKISWVPPGDLGAYRRDMELWSRQLVDSGVL